MNARKNNKYEDKEKKNVKFRNRVASIVEIQAYKNDNEGRDTIEDEDRKEKVRCRCIIY